MPPLILALDTAFTRCTVAVFDTAGDGRLLACAEPEIGKGHAERLTGVVDHVLAEAAATYGDLSRIVVTTGPGSFTGIRVGVAAARGLALALDIPAVGVSTLEALAHSALDAAGGDGAGAAVLSLLDARRGVVYAALFSGSGAPLAQPSALQPQEISAYVAAARAAFPETVFTGLRLVGTGVSLVKYNLAAMDPVVTGESDRIDPASLARLGARLPADEPPRPLYLRSADAKPSTAPSLRAGHAESIP